MALDMFQATVVPCVGARTNLSAILNKAESYAAMRKKDYLGTN